MDKTNQCKYSAHNKGNLLFCLVQINSVHMLTSCMFLFAFLNASDRHHCFAYLLAVVSDWAVFIPSPLCMRIIIPIYNHRKKQVAQLILVLMFSKSQSKSCKKKKTYTVVASLTFSGPCGSYGTQEGTKLQMSHELLGIFQ